MFHVYFDQEKQETQHKYFEQQHQLIKCFTNVPFIENTLDISERLNGSRSES